MRPSDPRAGAHLPCPAHCFDGSRGGLMTESVGSAVSGDGGGTLLDAPGPLDAMARPAYSVVVPVYRNAGTLAQVVARLTEIAERLPGALEVVFVVDGSPDASADVLRG